MSVPPLQERRVVAGRLSSLLIFAVIALLIPALFDYTEREASTAAHATILDDRLSLGVAVVLIIVYFANLAYSLVTHWFEGVLLLAIYVLLGLAFFFVTPPV